MLKCLTKTLEVVTELVNEVKPLLSFAREKCQSFTSKSFKCQESLDKICEERLANDWSRPVVSEPESMPLLQNNVAKE